MTRGAVQKRDREIDLHDLTSAIGYEFHDADLLKTALTHPSAISTGRPGRSRKPAKAGPTADNQRLEFLGDRVLGIAVAEMLFRAFPQEDEGALARRLAALVRQDSLDAVAREIG